ncbi:MAG: N-acetylneuraminate synthase family protein [Phycisphaerales bacterium]|nr:N-acetylneuraminate synthase family protein [Phycisphaerales bacterium]
MRIGERTIDRTSRPYVIAELGVNHDGSPERLLDLVRTAAESRADAIKLQLFSAGDLLASSATLADYQSAAGEHDPHAMLSRLEMPLEDARRAIELAHDLGLHAIATVFDLPLLPHAERLPLDAYKTASPDLTHKPLLDALVASNKPLIVSTGAADRDEVVRALEWLATAHDRLAVLQCVSCYPTPAEHAAVAAIEDLAAVFPGPIGYSDHTSQVDTGALAVSLGARVLEKHLTLDRSLLGPDHAASIEPAEMAEYVRLCRSAFDGDWIANQDDVRFGPPTKYLLPIESDVRHVARRSIVASRDLDPGHVLSVDDLAFKRPAGGLEPWQLGSLLGRRLEVAIPRDRVIMPDDVLD